MNRRFIVAYDIGVDRVRRRVALALQGHGVRLQRSVFVVESSQHELARLMTRLDAEALQSDDRLMAYPVVENAGLTPAWQSRQRATRVPDYWVL